MLWIFCIIIIIKKDPFNLFRMGVGNELRSKQRKNARHFTTYVCVRERERERESMTHEHRQVVRQVCSGRRIFEGCALHDGGCHGQWLQSPPHPLLHGACGTWACMMLALHTHTHTHTHTCTHTHTHTHTQTHTHTHTHNIILFLFVFVFYFVLFLLSHQVIGCNHDRALVGQSALQRAPPDVSHV
jgi:hypothetical protein